jgi:hypothetical protein
MDAVKTFTWCIDITDDNSYSVSDYPIAGKNGLSLCQRHALELEQAEDVIPDSAANALQPASYCWICD